MAKPPSLEEMREVWENLGDYASMMVSARGKVKVPFYRVPSIVEFFETADVCDINHIDFRVERTRVLDCGEPFLDIKIVGNGQVISRYKFKGWR